MTVQQTLFGEETIEEKKAPKKEQKKQMNNDEFKKLTSDTTIHYAGKAIKVTEYLSLSEIANGITDGESIRPITKEDLRKRMEEEYGEMTKGLTHFEHDAKAKKIVPVLSVRKKG